MIDDEELAAAEEDGGVGAAAVVVGDEGVKGEDVGGGGEHGVGDRVADGQVGVSVRYSEPKLRPVLVARTADL